MRIRRHRVQVELRAIQLLGSIGAAALELQELHTEVQLTAMRYMQTANPTMWRRLRQLLTEAEVKG